ncbi:MAG: TrpR-related protein YerC/YecD [Bacilli bacterium]|nr:TrpR-related protein YerC/YecD [Bacilli bacterium]
MNNKTPSKDLIDAILSIETEEECIAFLNDICTIQELEKLDQRLKAAIFLLDNQTYEKVIEKTKISSTTLSRVSRCIRYGDGGYKNIIDKINKE